MKEELLPIVHERLMNEKKSRINNNNIVYNNVALVHASHGCRDKIQLISNIMNFSLRLNFSSTTMHELEY